MRATEPAINDSAVRCHDSAVRSFCVACDVDTDSHRQGEHHERDGDGQERQDHSEV